MRARPETLRDAGILAPVDLHVADTLGRLCGDDDPDIVLAAALACRAPRVGHVCLEISAVGSITADGDVGDAPAAAFEWPDPSRWAERLATSPLVGGPDPEGSTPLVLDGGRLYLDRYWRYEIRLAERLLRLAQLRLDVDFDQAREVLGRLFPTSGDEPDRQRQSAEVAAGRGLAIVTGGPGTGKTTTVARILALLAAIQPGIRMSLAAPTGKAAARLEEAVRGEAAVLDVDDGVRAVLTGLEARTIHRLLGVRRDKASRFRHDASNPLAEDVVVVDEASMVSLALMAKLVDAVRDGARLVLVGDRDQLASVEAGAVLADVCGPRQPDPTAPLAPAIVHLERQHRYGPETGIGAVSRAVRRGDTDDALDFLRGVRTEAGVQGPYGDVSVVEPETDGLPAACLEEIVSGYRDYVRLVLDQADPQACLEAFERQRVLCALRGGPLGVWAVNRAIEAALAAEALGLSPAAGHYPGRPVLVTRNDYGVRLYTGDVGGVVRDPDRPRRLAVAFPGPRLVAPARLPPHETVFAMSIHKSQGSQFDRAFVVLPDVPSPVLTRELVYTAVTRARQRITLVASEEILGEALARRVSRASGLAERLWRE
jgi:exodeoxyribonuclease V alpha subunit